MVFQSYALFPNMSVADNIGFGLKVRKRPKADDRQAGRRAGRADAPRGPRPTATRGSCRAASSSASRSPARSPSSRRSSCSTSRCRRSTPRSGSSLRKEIRAIQRQLGITTVYVTHDQEEALSLSDRVVVMSEGRIEQIGTPSQIYNFPSTSFVASFVGTLNLVNAGVVDAGTGRLSLDGQEVRTSKPIAEGATGEMVTLAVRPGGDRAGRREPGAEPAERNRRGHQLPRLDRPDPDAPRRGQ